MSDTGKASTYAELGQRSIRLSRLLSRPDLPLYIAVGELDPVNGQLALVHALLDRYRAAGLTDITLRTYPEARHEV